MRDYQWGSCVSLPMRAYQQSQSSQELQHHVESHWQSLQRQQEQHHCSLEQQHQQQQHEQQHYRLLQQQLREQQDCNLPQQHEQQHYRLQQQQDKQHHNGLQQPQSIGLHPAGHNVGEVAAAAVADEPDAGGCCTFNAYAADAGTTAELANSFSHQEREAAAHASQTTATGRVEAGIIPGANVAEQAHSEEDLLGSDEEKEYYVWDPVLQEYTQTDAATGEALLHDPQYTQCHFRLVDDAVEDLHLPYSQRQQHPTGQQEQQLLHSQGQKSRSDQQQVDHQQQLCVREQQCTQQHLQSQQYTQRQLQQQPQSTHGYMQSQQYTHQQPHQQYTQLHMQPELYTQQPQEQKQYQEQQQQETAGTTATAAAKQKAEEERIAHAAFATPVKIDPRVAGSATAHGEEQQQTTFLYGEPVHGIPKQSIELHRQYRYNIEQQDQDEQHQQSDHAAAAHAHCTGSSGSLPWSAAATTTAPFVSTATHTSKCPAPVTSTLPAVTYPLSSTKLTGAAGAARMSYPAAASTDWNCCSSIAAPTGARGNSSSCCYPPCTSHLSNDECITRYSGSARCSTAAAGTTEISSQRGGPLSTAATPPGTATAAGIPLAATASPSSGGGVPPTARLSSTAALPSTTGVPAVTAETTSLLSAQRGVSGFSHRPTVAAAPADQCADLRSIIHSTGAIAAAPGRAATMPMNTSSGTANSLCAARYACYCGEAGGQSPATAAAPAVKQKFSAQAQSASTFANCCCCSSLVPRACCCGSYDQQKHELQQHKQLQQLFPPSQQYSGINGARAAVFPAYCGSDGSPVPAAADKLAPAAEAGQSVRLPTCAAAACCRCFTDRKDTFSPFKVDIGPHVPAWKSTLNPAALQAPPSVAATASPSHLAEQIPLYPAAAVAHSFPASSAAAAAERLRKSSNTAALIKGDGANGFRSHPHGFGCCCSNKKEYSCCFSSCCCTQADTCCSFAADCCHNSACCTSAECCAAAQLIKNREEGEESVAAQTTRAILEQQQQPQAMGVAQPYGELYNAKATNTEQVLQAAAERAAESMQGGVRTMTTTAESLIAETATALAYETLNNNPEAPSHTLEGGINNAVSCTAPASAAVWGDLKSGRFAAEHSTNIQPQHQWHTQQQQEQWRTRQQQEEWQTQQQQNVEIQQQKEMLQQQQRETLQQPWEMLQHPKGMPQQQKEMPEQQKKKEEEEELLQRQQWDMHKAPTFNSTCAIYPEPGGKNLEEKSTNNAREQFLQHHQQQQEALWWTEAAFAASANETEVIGQGDRKSFSEDKQEEEDEERDILLTSLATLQVQKEQQPLMLKQPYFPTRISTSRPWGDVKRSRITRSASFNIPTVSTSAVATPDAMNSMNGAETGNFSSASPNCAEEAHFFPAVAAGAPAAVHTPTLSASAYTNAAEKPTSFYQQLLGARPRTAAVSSGRGTHPPAAAAAANMHISVCPPATAADIHRSDERKAPAATGSDKIIKPGARACAGRDGGQQFEAAVVTVLPFPAQQQFLQQPQQHLRDETLLQQEQQRGYALQQHQQARRITLRRQQQQRRMLLQQQENSLHRSNSSLVQQQQRQQGPARRATYHLRNSTNNMSVAVVRNTETDSAAATSGHVVGESDVIASACKGSSLSNGMDRRRSNRTTSMPRRAATAREAIAREVSAREAAAREIGARQTAAREAAACAGNATVGIADGRRSLQQLNHLHKDHMLSFHAAARGVQHERSSHLATAAQQHGRAAASTRIAVPAVVKGAPVSAAGQWRRAEAAGSLRRAALQHESHRGSKTSLYTGSGPSSCRSVAAVAPSPVSVPLPGNAALPAGATGSVRSTGGTSSKARLSVAAGAAGGVGGLRRRLHDPVTRGRQLRAAWQEDPLVNKKNTFDVVAYETWLRNNGHLLRAKALELHQEEQRLLQLLQQQAPYNF